MTNLTKEEFIQRYVEHTLKEAGFSHFDDGSPVEEYARSVASSVFEDPDYRKEGPEACAEGDMSYWGEG